SCDVRFRRTDDLLLRLPALAGENGLGPLNAILHGLDGRSLLCQLDLLPTGQFPRLGELLPCGCQARLDLSQAELGHAVIQTEEDRSGFNRFILLYLDPGNAARHEWREGRDSRRPIDVAEADEGWFRRIGRHRGRVP